MIDGADALRAVQRPLAEASHAPGFLYLNGYIDRVFGAESSASGT